MPELRHLTVTYLGTNINDPKQGCCWCSRRRRFPPTRPESRLPSPRNTPAPLPRIPAPPRAHAPPAAPAPPLPPGPRLSRPLRLGAQSRLLPFQNSDNNRDAGNNNYSPHHESAPPAGQRSAPRSPGARGPPQLQAGLSRLPGPPRPAWNVQRPPICPSRCPGTPRFPRPSRSAPSAPRASQAHSEPTLSRLRGAPTPQACPKPLSAPQNP
ncbi:unnamed protein product [Rangifer tarandus platyrhynchus]|uniref:Uncharacterized protein n=1 Tax=Rangifer tarandus platyrhynchus TaxID=3082113 RepID=A0AC59YW86_RANTA